MMTENDTMQARSIKVVAVGYYGAPNVGDELLLGLLARQVRERGGELVALSINPEYTTHAHGIAALWDRPGLHPAVARYLDRVRDFNANGRLEQYPGSPAIAQALGTAPGGSAAGRGSGRRLGPGLGGAPAAACGAGSPEIGRASCRERV